VPQRARFEIDLRAQRGEVVVGEAPGPVARGPAQRVRGMRDPLRAVPQLLQALGDPRPALERLAVDRSVRGVIVVNSTPTVLAAMPAPLEEKNREE